MISVGSVAVVTLLIPSVLTDTTGSSVDSTSRIALVVGTGEEAALALDALEVHWRACGAAS